MGDEQGRGEAEATSRQFSLNAVHLVRTTQQINLTLSQMADQKASILMGATFVVFTIAIGAVQRAAAPLPLMILGSAAFLSAVFAVLAILPATGAVPGRVNLLFFGSFSRLDEDEYVEQLMEVLDQDETVFRTMAHDIYQNGRVLARKKYRLLGYAYRIFLAGLTASFVAVVVQMVAA